MLKLGNVTGGKVSIGGHFLVAPRDSEGGLPCPPLCFEAGIAAQHPAGPGTPASTFSVACSDGIWVQGGKGASQVSKNA